MLFVNWFRLVYAAVCCKASGGFVCLGRAGAELQSFNTWLSLVALADGTSPIVVVSCGRNCSDGQCASLLKRFPRLTRILLDGQAVTGDLPWPDLQVKGLESVMFWDTSVCDLALKRLALAVPSLPHLEIFGGQVTDTCGDHLRLLTHLRKLSLSRVAITDGVLSPLSELVRIESLDLSETRCSDAAMKAIARLGRLRHLNMSDTSVTDTGLAEIQHLPHLESLFIENTAVTDESIFAIESLTSLQALAIGGSLITADAVESLLQRRPGLEIARDPL